MLASDYRVQTLWLHTTLACIKEKKLDKALWLLCAFRERELPLKDHRLFLPSLVRLLGQVCFLYPV
jgi:hypothetical protein